MYFGLIKFILNSRNRPYESGRWPALTKPGREPRALPWAGMTDAVGVAAFAASFKFDHGWTQHGESVRDDVELLRTAMLTSSPPHHGRRHRYFQPIAAIGWRTIRFDPVLLQAADHLQQLRISRLHDVRVRSQFVRRLNV